MALLRQAAAVHQAPSSPLALHIVRTFSRGIRSGFRVPPHPGGPAPPIARSTTSRAEGLKQLKNGKKRTTARRGVRSARSRPSRSRPTGSAQQPRKQKASTQKNMTCTMVSLPHGTFSSRFSCAPAENRISMQCRKCSSRLRGRDGKHVAAAHVGGCT